MTDVQLLLKVVKGGRKAADLESFTLDFKTEKASFKETSHDLAEAAVCFANAAGGTILLGVRDSPGGADALVGTTIDEHKLRAQIHDLTQPHLVVTAESYEFDGKKFVSLIVPEGIEVYSTSQGEFRQRWQTECRPMAPTAVARLTDERKGADWSAGAAKSRIDDIEPATLERVRELLRATGDDEKVRLSTARPGELLAKLGLIHTGTTLTRAGELLMVHNPPCGPQELLVYQHRRTRSGEADYSKRWSSAMVVTFLEVLESVTSRLTITPVTLRNGQQLRIEDFPSIALREALTNALIHRDLQDNRPVLIEHSPAVLSTTSPGPLVAGVTENNILTRGTKPRYPSLAKAFNSLGWGEYLGQGVNRMFREMARSGRPLPEITSDPEGVSVRFRGEPPNANVARLVAELPDDLKDDTDTLIILLTLCARRTVTANQLAPLIQRSIVDAESALRLASQPGVDLIEPSSGTRNRRHPNYRFRGDVLARLGSAVAYHSRTSSEVDRKVVEHIREYGSINNGALQRLFDVDVYGARDLLKSLVDRDILVRISTQTRGKAVRYGAGSKFPEKRHRRTTGPPKAGQAELFE